MRPIDIIKRKVKELDNLCLNFTYQKSGNVSEIYGKWHTKKSH